MSTNSTVCQICRRHLSSDETTHWCAVTYRAIRAGERHPAKLVCDGYWPVRLYMDGESVQVLGIVRNGRIHVQRTNGETLNVKGSQLLWQVDWPTLSDQQPHPEQARLPVLAS